MEENKTGKGDREYWGERSPQLYMRGISDVWLRMYYSNKD
jgi:hypothetical protein